MRGLVLAALLSSSCRVAVPHAEAPLTKVIISMDVDDSVLLCVQPTAWMLFDDPNTVGPICVETVGSLRQRVLAIRQAGQ